MLRRAGTLLVCVSLLTGCAVFGFEPSPTTTYTNPSGTVVTVDWVDYPGHEGMDGEALIGYPDQAELEPSARKLVDQLRAAIAEASGLRLTSSEPESNWFDDDNWYPQEGNGYGGDSMLITVNCCELASDKAPKPTEWQAILEAASQVTEGARLGQFVMEEPYNSCDALGERCWRWIATARDGVQWVSFSIQDAALDPTGDAQREAEQFGWPPASIGFGYGATVVRKGSTDEYADAMGPFIGLKQPRGTSSD